MNIFNLLKRKDRIQSGRKSQTSVSLLRLERLENREMLSATPLSEVVSELTYVVITESSSSVVDAAEYTCKDLETFLAAQESDQRGIDLGSTLSVVEENIPDGVTVTYQWYRDDVAIDGADDVNYHTTVFDVGCSLSVRATGYGDYTGDVSSNARAVSSPTKDQPVKIDADFDQLKKALEIVADEGTIRIKSSDVPQTIVFDSTLTINGNVTIDGGGNILSGGASASSAAVLSEDVDTPVADYAHPRVDHTLGLLMLLDATISDFSGEYGGGIYCSAEIIISNVTISNCYADVSGGGVYFDEGSEVSIDSLTVEGCEAKNGSGGGIYCASGVTINSMTNITINGNSATGNGGGIYCASGVTFGKSISNVAITENSAGKNGGGIFNGAGNDITICGSVIRINGNSAGLNGGAIANLGSITIVTDDATNEEFSTISENSATRFGGAYFGCGSFTVKGKCGITFDGNKVGYADGYAKEYSGAKGGAVYNSVNNDLNLKGTVVLEADITFSSNQATERGGAIQTYSGLTISGNVTFEENEAFKYGGAVDVGTGGYAILSGNLVFESNKALGIDGVDGFGGAIFSVSSEMIDKTHGGVYFVSGYSYTFTGNYAESSGGALDICAGLVHFGGTFTFTGNKANGPHGDDATGLGGALAFAAYVEIEENTVFNWGVGNSAARGNCVAIDTAVRNVEPEEFGLPSDPGDDYSTFKVIRKKVSKENTLTPSEIAADAVSMNLTIGDRTTTVGAEGITPEELGISTGVYETLVEYTDADGNTSPVYSFVLTVDQSASLNVVEKTIADGRGVQYFFDVVAENYATPSSWLINWGDGKTSRIEKLSSNVMAAHYYQEDGNFDVSLTLVFDDGTTKEFSGFATRTIGENVETEARAEVFATSSDDLFDTLDCCYGPFFQER